MHLRSLTLQALGPFAGRYTIDFEQLGASGLYLLEGPTGAGKSTIIDAIVFALYGKVASADSSDDRLRSGYADDETETFVDLVFETGSGAYRVLRSPEYLRAKRRGAGTTKQQASVKLWRLAGPDGPGSVPGGEELDADGGELISARLDEAGAEIQRAIGLDRSQFVQTIVLPQGEFASFLRADPEHRRGLLQKVFGTAVYERVQEQLGVMRVDAQRAVTQALGGVGSAAAHFVGAAGITDVVAPRVAEAPVLADPAVVAQQPARALRVVRDDERNDERNDAPSDGPPDYPIELATASEIRALAESAAPELLTAVQAHTVALAAAARRAATEDAAAASALKEASAAHERTRALSVAVDRREILRAERAHFFRVAGRHAANVAKRDLARRAVVLAAVVAAADAAERAADRATAQLERARSEAAAQVSAELAALDRAGALVARDEIAARVATLERLVALERGLPARRRSLAADVVSLDDSLAERATLGTDLAARPALRDALGLTIDATREIAADLPVRRQREEQARAARKAARSAHELEVALTDAIAGAADSLRVAREAIATEAHLRERRLAGIAGELAAALVPGSPCPVCGGLEHPHAAALDADHATAEQVAEAERARVAAERASTSAAGVVTTLTERLAGQRERAGTTTLAEHDAVVVELVAGVAAAVAAQTELGTLRDRLADLDAETEKTRDRLQGLATSIAAARASIAAHRSELVADEREIDAARGDAPTVAAKVEELATRIRACTSLATALETSENKELDRGTRAGELAAGLVEQGFASAADARAALLPAEQLALLETAVTAHDVGRARVEAGLAEPALANLADGVVVDLEGARDAHERAEAAASAAVRAAALAGSSAAAAATALGAVEGALVAHGVAREAAAPVTRMAELAAASSGGDNAKRLTLATYVLVKRFEDVVAAANERLMSMSDGRFELMRSDEREDVRSRRTGLSMKIVDHRMEAARDPRTLSGGETFYVSLCLALGMADVVTAEAGGIELGTLFVDEGFGSLDPETLEAVLAVLSKLRTGGRVVGVVSHVEALKQSIAERIEVRRLPDGSSTLTVRAG